jgi:hypothetical protein
MVNKAIVIENKIKEMEKDGKRKVSFSRQSSGSNASASATPSVSDAATKLSSPTSELPDAEASTAATSTQRAATISPEHAARPHSNAQPCTVHQLKEAVLVELVSNVV